jgi:hypothetical protein
VLLGLLIAWCFRAIRKNASGSGKLLIAAFDFLVGKSQG